METFPLIIGGERVWTGKSFEVIFPYNGELVHNVSLADEKLCEDALSLAEKSFEITSRTSIYERRTVLEQLSELIKNEAEDFAQLITLESGKPIREARVEVARSLEVIQLSIAAASKKLGEVLAIDSAANAQNKWGFYQRFPIGVAAFITPFNFPLNLVMHKIAPAIASGCPFVLKPASKTPRTALKLGELIVEAKYPKAAVNVVCGSGASIGEYLVKSRKSKVISFTGSLDVGRRISELAVMKSVALELGSNSAAIVLPDADIMRAVSRISQAAYSNAGQVCISTQRAYIHSAIFEQFLELLVSSVSNIELGDPRSDTTELASMISEQEAIKAEQLIKSGGGEIVFGGKRTGSTLEPTIIINVPENSHLIQSEIFAPVLVVNKFDSFNDALSKANSTEYGLQLGIFTGDLHKARYAFDNAAVGAVLINEVPTFRADLMPYGGVKQSGMLREGPEFAIEHLTYLKSFIVHKEEL